MILHSDFFALKLQDRKLKQERLNSQSRHQDTFLKHRFDAHRFNSLFSLSLPFSPNILMTETLKRRQEAANRHGS